MSSMQQAQARTAGNALRGSPAPTRYARFRAVFTRLFAVTAVTGITGLGLGLGPSEIASASTANLGSCIGAGQVINPGQYLDAPTVRVGIDSFSPYRLWMQGDGNLVAYNSAGRALWDSNTVKNPGAHAVLQSSDGNLVVYSSSGRVLWSAYVPNAPGDKLCMQDDGNVVVYGGNAALWATMSGPVWARGPTSSGNYYPQGQCTWWAEQQAAQYANAFLPNLGNALSWASNAQQMGWPVNNTPAMGSIAVFQPGIDGAGSVGHVAWVTEVYPSQNAVVITEMNYRGLGVVDTRRISPAFGVGGLQYIHMNP